MRQQIPAEYERTYRGTFTDVALVGKYISLGIWESETSVLDSNGANGFLPKPEFKLSAIMWLVETLSAIYQ